MTGTLSTSYNQLIGVYSDTLHIICVSCIVSLALLLYVEKYYYSCHEVYYLARWEKVEIAATVFASENFRERLYRDLVSTLLTGFLACVSKDPRYNT